MPLFGFPTLGPGEIILIVLLIVLLFGAKKIPELMRGLGGGLKEFKKAASLDEEQESKNQINEKAGK